MKRQQLFLGLLLLLLATLVTYSNHFHNAFQFDDSHVIENNLYIRDINNLGLFFEDGSTISTLPSNQAYRPLVAASLAIDYWLGQGYDLFYFHLSTFILFLIMGILIVLLSVKIFNISDSKKKYSITIIALFSGAWYLLHPANAETVNYVSARSDVQSTFFVVLGLVLYQYSSFCRKYFVYLIPIVIGGLAKPTVVMFAPILLFYMLLFEEQLDLYQIFKKEFFKKTVQSLIKALPSFIVCVILYWFINEMTPNSWQPGGYSPFLYLITQPFVITHYFFTFFAPISLSADSDWQLIDSIWNYQFFIGILFILFLVFIAFKTSKKAELRPISFGILWFFFALIPTSSIIPLGEVLNDHRMFFPFIGLAMAVAWAIGLMIYKNFDLVKNSNYKNYIFITGFLFLSAYAFGTYQRNKVWHSGESLWWDVVNKSPNNGRALMNYGLVLMGKGDYKGALEYYTKAKETVPNYSTLYINIAIAKKETGDIIGAENCYKKAIELNKFDPNCYSFYSKFLIAQKRNREAASLIENGLSLSPKHQDLLLYKIQNDLALSDSSVNSQNSKSQYLLKLSQTYPTPENYINLSLEYYNEGNYQKCIDAAQQALILKPDYDLAYNNICAAYNRLKKWDKAIEAGNKGISINPNNQLLRNNLNESLRFAK